MCNPKTTEHPAEPPSRNGRKRPASEPAEGKLAETARLKTLNNLEITLNEITDPLDVRMKLITDACMLAHILISRDEPSGFFVLTFKPQGEEVHFVYAHGLRGEPDQRSERVVNLLERGEWSVLKSALFIIYRNKAYRPYDRETPALISAIQNRTSPETATLLL